MAFTPVYAPERRGRTPHQNRVTAIRSGEDVIAVMLSGDLAAELGVAARSQFHMELGTGVDHGKLRVSRARARSGPHVPAYQNGRKVGFNLRQAMLPNAAVPEKDSGVILPHAWRSDTLIIDLSPLAGRGAETAKSPQPYQTEQTNG